MLFRNSFVNLYEPKSENQLIYIYIICNIITLIRDKVFLCFLKSYKCTLM